MAITNFSSLSLMASTGLSAIYGLALPRSANPVIASIMDDGEAEGAPARSIANTNQSPSDNARSLTLQLFEPPRWTHSDKAWCTEVAKQTLRGTEHTQADVDKLANILSQDRRYTETTAMSLAVYSGTVGVVALASWLIIPVTGVELPSSIIEVYLAMPIVYLVQRYNFVANANEAMLKAPLTITEKEWGGKLPTIITEEGSDTKKDDIFAAAERPIRPETSLLQSIRDWLQRRG